MKPRIGITPSPTEDVFPHGRFRRYALEADYVDAVEAAGGIPLILPPQRGADLASVLDALDGVLISGGGDVRPSRYGDPAVHPKTGGIDDARDDFEIALVRAAVARGLPLMSICRGTQLVNVALGGTLIQDVADQWGTAVEHSQEARGIAATEPSHTVTIAPDSLVARIYGATSLATNSFHHQAIRDVSPELIAVAHAPDGIVEAVECRSGGWVLGLQWHPETMFRARPEHLRPFAALIAAARAARREAAVADD